MTNHPIFTIGYSHHAMEDFLALLAKHRVTALADVRSAPYSRFSAHFNRDVIPAALKSNGIRYVYLGRELGGRPDDPACYVDGRTCYEKVAQTRIFRDGIARVVKGAAQYRTALMCAEKEPLDCHRTLLVARALTAEGVDVIHILATGELEPQARTMDRLMMRFGLNPDGDLFQSREQLIAQAIAQQAGRVAFVHEDTDSLPRREVQ